MKHLNRPFKSLTLLNPLLKKVIPGFKKLPNRFQKFTSVVLLIAILLTLLPPFSPFWNSTPKAEAAWFDDSWSYRKTIAITAHTAQETNKYISVTIDTATLTTDKLQADCDDMRFTKYNGELLPYYIVSGCDTASTVIHVNFNVFPAGAQTIYFYYGNPASGPGKSGADFASEAANYTVGSQGSEEKAQSPVGYWRLDEGQGTSISDSMGFSTNGTLTNSPAWQTENMCISGKCLRFTGASSQSVSVPDANNQLRPSGNTMTVSAWYKRQTTSSTGTIAQKGASGVSGWTVSIGIAACTTNQMKVSKLGVVDICLDGVPADTNWHMMEVVYDTTGVTLYIDGVAKGTSGNTASFTATTSNLIIGNGDAGGFFSGFIDELKVYDYSRSAAQVKLDYNTVANSNMSGNGSVLGANTENMPNALSSGLAGYWKMDATSGNATDSSGNSLTLTNNSSTAYALGKFDGAGTFVAASTDYFSTATTISGIQTVSFWTYNASTTDEYINLTASAYITSSNGTVSATGFTSPTIYVNGVESGTLTANAWNLVTVTTGTAINANQFEVGRANSAYNNGKIDDVRVYSRALNNNQITQLYNWAPGPNGYWKLDENNGTAPKDSSGYGVNGTFTGNPGWAKGYYGSAFKSDGNGDYVSLDLTNFQNPTRAITLSAWIKLNSNKDYNHVFARDNWATGGFNAWQLFTNASGQVVMGVSSGASQAANATTTTTLSTGQWYYVTGTYDGSNARVYINGVLSATGSTSSLTFSSISAMVLSSGSTVSLDGLIDDAKVYAYARTSQQIVSDMNALHPAGGSPVGSQAVYYRFDEGYGTTTNNSITPNSAISGTITEAAWTQSGRNMRALDFDGTNDVVTVSNATAIDLNDNLSNFTFSTWIYPDSDGEADTGQIFQKGTTTYFRVDSQDGSNNLDLEANLDLATTDANVNVADAFTIASWNHVAMSWDGTTLRVYVNGKLRGSGTGSGAISADANNLLIGGGTSNNFDGKIDEFKIYNSALALSEIQIDANSGASQVLGAAGNNSSYAPQAANQEYCVPGDATSCAGPVGRWDFEEGNGNTQNDTSGNSNTCTTFSDQFVYTAGRIGKALEDGPTSGGDISCGSGTTLDNLPASGMTLEAWIYPATMGQFNQGVIMTKSNSLTNGWSLFFSGTNALTFQSDYATTDLVRATANNSVTLNAWNHVAMTWTGSSTATTVLIYINGREVSYSTTTNGSGARNSDAAESFAMGNDTAQFSKFDGKIDVARAFNYVRTPAQIAYDYNRGGPVGQWRIDECQGTTLNDASGNSLTGTLTIGGTGTQTTAGTCTTPTDGTGAWYNGRNGKLNYSVSFDGTDDYAEVASSTKLDSTAGTWAGWVKTSQGTSSYYIVMVRASGTSLSGITMFQDITTGKLRAQIKDGSGTVLDLTGGSAINDGAWHHFALTFNGTSTASLYVDGKLANSGTPSGSWSFGANSLRFADANDPFWSFWTGQLDDMRVYNYPMSASQVKTLLNNTGAVRYAPVTGAP